jgi:tetratricopeptide (TPR) repeat protein
METYYTTEEKFLQAVDELSFGETPKALQLLNALLEAEPAYARTYYQLGVIYYYHLMDYKAAGYYLGKCTELDPSFAPVYADYLKLLVFLNMEKKAKSVAEAAIHIPGVCPGVVYQSLGLLHEKKHDYASSLVYYQKSALNTTDNSEIEKINSDINRVKQKMEAHKKYKYHFDGSDI